MAKSNQQGRDDHKTVKYTNPLHIFFVVHVLWKKISIGVLYTWDLKLPLATSKWHTFPVYSSSCWLTLREWCHLIDYSYEKIRDFANSKLNPLLFRYWSYVWTYEPIYEDYINFVIAFWCQHITLLVGKNKDINAWLLSIVLHSFWLYPCDCSHVLTQTFDFWCRNSPWQWSFARCKNFFFLFWHVGCVRSMVRWNLLTWYLFGMSSKWLMSTVEMRSSQQRYPKYSLPWSLQWCEVQWCHVLVLRAQLL